MRRPGDAACALAFPDLQDPPETGGSGRSPATLAVEVASLRRELQAARIEHRRIEAALRASESKYERAFRSSPGAISISTAAEGRFLEANDTFLRITGFQREEILGRTGAELGLWVDPAERAHLVRLLKVERTVSNREFAFRTRSGEERVVLLSAELIRLGRQDCIFTTGLDISEHKRAFAALKASEERYALAARGANDGLWDWDLETRQIYFSPRFKEMLGESAEAVGAHPAEWFRRVHPEDRDRVGMEVVAHLEGLTAHFESEHRMRHRDGVWRVVLSRGLAVHDAFGAPTRFVGSQTDITVRKRAEARLLHEGLHDALTDLPNRTLFLDRLSRAVERAKRRDDHGFAVIVLDLDRFKLVNDSLGHAAGDLLLQVLAARLLACGRPEDTVARFGGDEFALLLEGVRDESDVTRVAERVLDTSRQPYLLGAQEVFVTASLGVAVSSSGYEEAEDVVRDADTALHRAKAGGRARYELFDHTMHERVVKVLRLENDLRRAVERGQLSLAFQPIVRLDDGQVAAFEALLRWNHPERGPVPPGEFVPLAEESGLIHSLGRFVVSAACGQARRLRDRFGDGAVPVAVNVSPLQLQSNDLVLSVKAGLAEAGVPGCLLHVEITESALMENPGVARSMLEQLRELSVRVSLDDFGTGYSCLSHLHLLPIDTLKIDQSFASRLARGKPGDTTVRAILALARGLGMEAVAEGVETREQCEELRRLGATFAQGYFFSRPLDGERALDFLSASLEGC